MSERTFSMPRPSLHEKGSELFFKSVCITIYILYFSITYLSFIILFTEIIETVFYSKRNNKIKLK